MRHTHLRKDRRVKQCMERSELVSSKQRWSDVRVIIRVHEFWREAWVVVHHPLKRAAAVIFAVVAIPQGSAHSKCNNDHDDDLEERTHVSVWTSSVSAKKSSKDHATAKYEKRDTLRHAQPNASLLHWKNEWTQQ